MALTDNLQAFWELSNLIDAHGSNNLGNNNVATFVAGKVGNCVNLVALSEQYLSIADNAALSMADIDFMGAFWAYLADKSGSRVLVAKWDFDAAQREYLMQYNQALDRFQFLVSSDGTTNTPVAANNFGSPSTATWYFIVFWHNATANTINIQVNDGTADSAAHTTGVFDGTSAFQLGKIGASPSTMHDGRLDQVGIWKRILTTDERAWLYNSGNGRTYAEVLAGIPAAGAYTRPCIFGQDFYRTQ